MSYYFSLAPKSLPPLARILAETRLPGVEALSPEAPRAETAPFKGFVNLFQPGLSARGVTLSSSDQGIEVGLNAFTTVSDARLAAAVARALAELGGCDILPEDRDTPLAAAELAAYCDAAWEQDRRKEAEMLLSGLATPSPQHDTLTLSGYRRNFMVSARMVAEAAGRGRSLAQMAAEWLEDFRTLQEIGRQEQIHAPPVILIGRPAPAPAAPARPGPLARLIGAKPAAAAPPAPKGVPACLLPPGTRTLIPSGVKAVLLRDAQDMARALPLVVFEPFATARGFRRYGADSYDVPALGAQDYADLLQRATAAAAAFKRR